MFDDLKNKLGEGFSGSDMSSVAAPNLKNRLVQPFGSAQDGFLSKFTRQSADPFPTRHFYFSTTSGRQNLHAAEADFSWQYRATYR